MMPEKSSSPLWFNKNITLGEVIAFADVNMGKFLGIEFVRLGHRDLEADLAVTDRVTQPMNLLHGGASCVLAETLASVAGNLVLDSKTQYAVGLEINANHLKGVPVGSTVTGVTSPLHIGKTTQVWQTEIHFKGFPQKRVCVSRMTLSVVTRK